MAFDKLRVADFFCGAGGFSEGFRQAGFDVVFGLDNWKPAVDTHNINHKLDDKAFDILEIKTPEKIDSIVPDTEVIIGSPPCVTFSGSNKAGKADKAPGILLIEAYLRIVAWKLNKPDSKLKYWLMENVPNSARYTKERYTFEELGLPGGSKVALDLTDRHVLNAADYGTPQGRKRFICGSYPKPPITHSGRESLSLKPWVHMRSILGGLSDPLDGHDNEFVTDPNYGFRIKRSELTDHYYDTRVVDFEWKNAKRLKEDHGYMGKMSFPEDLDRPSRTVMATRSASTREAMILGGETDKEGNFISYRMPTIREIACMMSFPITYQFEANSEASKYRLVGNAVCPLMARSIANAIAEEEGVKQVKGFIPLKEDPRPSVDLTGREKVEKVQKPKKPNAKYARHIPHLKVRGFRAELDNLGSDFERGKVIWTARLHQGAGKGHTSAIVDEKSIESMLDGKVSLRGFDEGIERLMDGLPGSQALQEIYTLHREGGPGPDELLGQIRELLDKHYPEKEFEKNVADNPSREVNIPRDSVPLRVLLGAYALQRIVKQLHEQ